MLKALQSFQLPLSGSRGSVQGVVARQLEATLSTPSLGITRMGREKTSPEADFQLPLSGSPSPIPGFSGSPRLSAAAPLRTNEF